MEAWPNFQKLSAALLAHAPHLGKNPATRMDKSNSGWRVQYVAKGANMGPKGAASILPSCRLDIYIADSAWSQPKINSNEPHQTMVAVKRGSRHVT